MILRIIAFLLTCSLATAAFAGAWLEPRGETLAILQFTSFTGDRFFDKNGQLQSQPRFTKFELQPYAEYGLSDAVTIGGTAYLHEVAQSGDTNEGLGDPTFFLRTRLWHNDNSVISLQPLVKMPSYYMSSDLPRGGSRSTDAELALLYGKNLHLVGSRDYLDTGLGYRMRSSGLHPQLRADAALGLRFTDHFLLIPAVHGIYTSSIGHETFSENGEQDYDLLKAELSAAWLFTDDRWVQATFFDHVAGVQTGNGYGVSIAYAERF